MHGWLMVLTQKSGMATTVLSHQRKDAFSSHIYWIGEAYEKLTSVEYDHLRLRVWEKTDCLIKADESDDQLINPEGLKNCVVPPPGYFPPSAWLPQIVENPVSGAEHIVSEEEAGPEDPCWELPDTNKHSQ